MSDDRRAFFRGLVRSAAEMTGAAAAAAARARAAPTTPSTATRASSCSPSGARRRSCALREASVLVVGAGALGSPVAAYLVGAGVGRIGIVDSDDVEVSNLQRQWLHFTPDVGVAKAESAAAKLRFLNPEAVVEPY